MKICVFGVGSLGANTVINLTRRFETDIEFIFVDFDRIESVNLANQPWYDLNIGQSKATVLSAYIYRVAKCKSVANLTKITDADAFVRNESKNLKDVTMFLDCFDNIASRKITQQIADALKKPILHSGFADNIMMCKWGKEFPLPNTASTAAPVCNRRELGSLITLGAGFTQLVVSNFLLKNKRSWAFLELHDGIAKLHME